MAAFYSVVDILKAAKVHPFYNPSSRYPQRPVSIARGLGAGNEDTEAHLATQPLLHKDQLCKVIDRLGADDDPENHYRLNSYASITGGGSGKGVPMLFLTDAAENQSQRVAMGHLMKACKLIDPTDWVLNLHPSGFFYRALDLSTQNLEQAGATILCAGHLMPHTKSVAACLKYRVNVVTGDSAHILNFAHYFGSLPENDRRDIKITKIIYTAEMMSRSKREYLVSVFGAVSFYSMFASAETGPWAVSNFNMTGEPDDESAADLIFDTRAMKIEVLSLSSETLKTQSRDPPNEDDMVPEGTTGHLVLTCLQRLKNPLVRFVSGDVGSVHPLPQQAKSLIEADLQRHLKILRLYGRDQRFSFKWLSEYYDFGKLDRVMQTEGWGILQWQIIIENGKDWEGSDTLELRIMRRREDERTIGDDELLKCLYEVFFLTSLTEKLFRAIFLNGVEGFERSETSRKVVRFIDKRAQNLTASNVNGVQR